MKLGVTPLLVSLALSCSIGCSSTSSDSPNPGPSSAMNGVVVGAADTHCKNRPLGIADPAICQVVGGVSDAGSAGGADNASGGAPDYSVVPDCNLEHDSGYGPTLYNGSGDDDDCKYHMSWTSTPIQKGQPFTITVTANSLADGAPLDTIASQKPGAPALTRIEPYLPCDLSHQAPTSTLEAPIARVKAGQFTVGPLVLDESGRWIIRYHFYELCFNNVTTPHAHIAFYVEVP